MTRTVTDCGCTEGRRFELSRRGMLKAMGGAALFTTVVGDAELAFGATATGTEHVLVTIVLAGGIDGLSVVPPIGDPNYASARPSIAVPGSLARQVDSTFGLHPALAPLFPLWSSGDFAAVQAVGQESPTRSHFDAMDELERAAPGSSLRTGWLDRTIGTMPDSGVLEAVAVGASSVPGSLRGNHAKIAATSLKDIGLPLASAQTPVSLWQKAIGELHAGARPEVSTPMSNALSAVTAVEKLAAATPAGGYPGDRYGTALRDVASLVKAKSGLRVAHVQMGGWDHHTNIGKASGGRFATKLSTVAQGLAAFATDLGPDLSRVTVITLSEFGRRVKENGNGGLDHGHGNCMLVLGGGIKGGKVYGTWPGLGSDKLDRGDLAGTTDYRTVISEILTKKMGVGSAKDVFPGLTGTALGLI